MLELNEPRPAARRPYIQVRSLAAGYGGRPVIQDITFSVAAGEILVIMGRSGCGKTTLLKGMIGLVRPSSGSVAVLDREITAMDEDALDDFREHVGMLFQFGALISSLTVGENLLLPLIRRGRVDEDTARAVAALKLGMVGLPEAFPLYPSQLSGGMKKRAGFARALMLDPKIVFFDEPTSGLDPNTAADMDRLILSLRELLGTTMVVVTHDLATAFSVADRIVMLHEGRMVAEGAPADLRASTDPAVQDFVQRRESRRRGTETVRCPGLMA